MKTSIHLTAVAVALVGGVANAGAPLLTAFDSAPGCGHVLDLLHRYGGLEGAPRPTGHLMTPSPLGAFAMPVEEIGDLCVATVEEGPCDPGCPPTIIVGVTNHSTRPVCKVHVSVVALLGPIKSCDPSANVCIEEIPAGGTVEVELVLPAEALAMGDNGGAPIGFQKLLVAADSYDRYVELDEANNLKLICRADLPKRVATTTTAVEEVSVAPAAPSVAPSTSVERPALDKALEEFGVTTTEANAARAQW